ncbi:MAG: pyruvate kinase, partial [Burkholderiaceae bacterium]
MHKHKQRQAADTWDEAECRAVIDQLWALRASLQAYESGLTPLLQGVDPGYEFSARNLAHYLALRHSDQRALQEWLTRVGLSSLGRAESHVMANLDKVLGILHRLTGQPWESHSGDEPIGIKSSRKLLERHTADLLGPTPSGRSVRIMVTLPSEAAGDFGLVRRLVTSGMDIARINCAHDGPAEWKAMAAHVRRAAKSASRPVRILMDLGGPKLRTGPVAQGAEVLRLKPLRDEVGRLVTPARIGLRPAGATMPVAGAPVHAGVDVAWLAHLEVGDHIDFKDARGADRRLLVVHQDESGFLAECAQTAYLVSQTQLKRKRKGHSPRITGLADLPRQEGLLHLERGGSLRLTRGSVEDLPEKGKGKAQRPVPTVACTLPEVFGQVCVGERIWFDDGRIGGVIKR